MGVKKKRSPRCGAKTRGGSGTCRNPAGFRTSHLGRGKCFLHGGCSPIKHGRYSKVHKPLAESFAEYEQDERPLDLLPEIALLRGLIREFVDRQSKLAEAISEWHSVRTLRRLSKWLDDIPKAGSAEEKARIADLIHSEYVKRMDERPVAVPDIAGAGSLIKQLADVAAKHDAIHSKRSISFDEWQKVQAQQARSLIRHVAQLKGGKDAIRAIEAEWAEIRV